MSLSTSSSAAVRAPSLALANQALVVFVSALVFLPSALFATSLKPAPALAVLAGCCGAMALIISRPRADLAPLAAPLRVPHLLVCIGSALVILLLGGETHLFYATSDWQIRDAVLADLVAHGFPATYHFGDTDYVLRAPLGMYMVPALVGRIFGLKTAHVALLTQNALFLGSIFYLLKTVGRGWVHLAVLVLFAGLSIFGALMMSALDPRPGVVPWLLLYGLDSWHPFFQYSSSMVQFFWVPNHALPGWWLATLMLVQRPSSPDVATVGVSVAGLAFWSPLAVIPVVPWLLYCLIRSWRPVLFSWRTWLGAGASSGFLPILFFMVIASGSIAHDTTVERPDFLAWYAIFIVLALPALVFLACVRREIPRQSLPLVAIGGFILLVLPLFRFGPNNDLVMRASIAPLVVVAFVFGSVVIDLVRRRKPGGYVGLALVALTLPSAAVEIGRALSTPRWAISDCSLMEASQSGNNKGVPSNYVAPVAGVPTWLLDLTAAQRASVEARTCWPNAVAPRLFGTTFIQPEPAVPNRN